ncbi:unnamed protein product [Caenorhabditis nigoni]
MKAELLNRSLSFPEKTHNARMKLEPVEKYANHTGLTFSDKLDQLQKSQTKFGQPDTIRSIHKTLFKRWDSFEKNIDDTKDDRNKEPNDFLDTLAEQSVEEKVPKEHEQVRAKLPGVGQLLKELRMEHYPPQKERIVLDGLGFRYRDPAKFPISRMHEVQIRLFARDGEELPEMEMPNDIRVARKMIRKKMIRCKKCKTRFLEKNLYERHLRDKHPELYDLYIEQQREECEAQKQADRDRQLFDEMQTGSFIPPEEAVAELLGNPNYIPLPGEDEPKPWENSLQNRIRQLKRPSIKKVSPQCPFCDKRFRDEISLKRHFAKTHPDIGDFKQCLKCFTCVPESEMNTHHCELTYVCFDCTPVRNLVTEHRLYNHRSKFHRGASSGFACKECLKRFLTPRKLRKHMKMSHVFTTTYQCHFCDELFVNETARYTDERIHTGIIKFECQICDHRANRYSDMEEHNLNEHGYVCPICQHKTLNQGDMSDHVFKTHEGYLASEDSIPYIESPRLWMLFKGE